MKLINRFDGRELVLSTVLSPSERSLWRLRKRIANFDKFVRFNDMKVSFLTITQSDKSVADGYRWVTDVMAAMRKQVKRAGCRFAYVAVLEIQPKRYREYGVLAPHWHIAIGVSLPCALPHGERVDGRIKKVRNGSLITWDWLFSNIKQKFGMYFVCDCWSLHVYDYLGKYIAKGGDLDDFKRKLGRRVRVFSGSRVPIDFQMTDGQALEYIELLKVFPDFAELYCRREDTRIVFRAKSIGDEDIFGFSKITYPRVHAILGDWSVVDSEWIYKKIGGDGLEE